MINFEEFPLCRETLSPSWAKSDEKQRREYLRSGLVPLDYLEPVAADWPDLLDIVERRVKPERLRQNDPLGRLIWWRFLRTRGEMKTATAGLDQVLGIARVCQHAGFVRLPAGMVYSDQFVVFASNSYGRFAILQSRVHEVWARMMASTLEDRLRYTPTDCFETFPFPASSSATSELESLGESYYRFRASLMVSRNQGMTSLYNDFNNRIKQDAEILELQRLHAEMDRAVLAAYGWNEPIPACDFFEENPAEEDDEEPHKPKEKKFRYRWPDDFRDEILARLLQLNRERAEEEAEARRKRETMADRPLFSRRNPSKESEGQMSLL